MKTLNNYINESVNNKAENFIKEIYDFISKNNKYNYIKISLNKKDNSIEISYNGAGLDFAALSIFGIDDTDNYGYDFKYLPNNAKNVFFTIVRYGTGSSDESSDDFYDYLKNKKDKSLNSSIKKYNGFEKGHNDQDFYAYYSINDKMIKKLEDFLLEFCKTIKNKMEDKEDDENKLPGRFFS